MDLQFKKCLTTNLLTEWTQKKRRDQSGVRQQPNGLLWQIKLFVSDIKQMMENVVLSFVTCLKVLKSSDLAASPCMLSATTVLARDFELPGLPTTNNGILSSMHTTIMNTFSLKAVFLAMLGPSFNSFSTAL